LGKTSGVVTVSNAIALSGTNTELTAALVASGTLVVAGTSVVTISDNANTSIAATVLSAIGGKTSGAVTATNSLVVTGTAAEATAALVTSGTLIVAATGTTVTLSDSADASVVATLLTGITGAVTGAVTATNAIIATGTIAEVTAALVTDATQIAFTAAVGATVSGSNMTIAQANALDAAAAGVITATAVTGTAANLTGQTINDANSNNDIDLAVTALHLDLDANLSGLSTTSGTLTAAFGATVVFTGNLGTAVVTVADSATLTSAASIINGNTINHDGSPSGQKLVVTAAKTADFALEGSIAVEISDLGVNLDAASYTGALTVTTVSVNSKTIQTGAGGSNITLGAVAATNITGSSGIDNITFDGATAYTGTIALAAGVNVINLVTGSNIGGATVSATGGSINFGLASGASVTMDDATHDLLVAGTVTAGGSETITISDAATITTDNAIEAYSIAAGMAVTVGTTSGSVAQVITETGTEAVSTVTLGNGVYTGDWVGFDAADIVKVNASGSDISGNTGLNAGVKVDFQSATANTTLNATQNGVVTFVGAASNTQTVNLSAVDTFTTTNTIEAYSGIGGGVVTLAASHAAANIAMTTAAATTLNVGAQTVTGTYALADSADVLKVTATADISGINSGALTTAENLDLTTTALINATMTEAQYHAFTGITANAGNDTITIKAGSIAYCY